MKDIAKYISGLLIIIVLLLGAKTLGFYEGVQYQKKTYVAQQTKANNIVVEKNDNMEKSVEKETQIQIVYKDRIVTKYQTITKEVIKYEETPAANVKLDSEFIRLHNSAATNPEVEAPKSTEGTDGEDNGPEATTGEAINIISQNYQKYYECKARLEGWQRFYSDLQRTMNE